MKAALYSILGVSIDRYWAICFPLNYRSKSTKITKVIIAISWTIAVADGLMPILGWNTGNFEGKCDLRVLIDLEFIIYGMLPFCIFATVVIIILNYLIYRSLKQQVNFYFTFFKRWFKFSSILDHKTWWNFCHQHRVLEQPQRNKNRQNSHHDRWNFFNSLVTNNNFILVHGVHKKPQHPS